MKSRTLILGSLVIALGLIAAGRFLGGGGTPTQQSAYRNSAARATVGTPDRNGVTAPAVVLERLGGGTISLAEYRGKKPVVVDFWASWCPNCRRDMPNLNRFYEAYKDRVEVIGINLQEPEGTVADFIASRGISFPIALDPSGDASAAFGIRYTNTHFLIDRDGRLIRTIPGDIREADMQLLLSS